MSRSGWLSAIAIGLIIFAASGQTQDQAQGPQGQESAQQRPAPNLGSPLRVEIVEDKAKADASERHEAERRDREKADLVAQQGMNEAAQRMAVYALWQTIATWFGAFLVAVTLVLMIQANKAAVKAVNAAIQSNQTARDIGQAQVRAYLSGISGTYRIGPDAIDGIIVVKNYGQSPAKHVNFTARIGFYPAVRYGLMSVNINAEPIKPFHWLAHAIQAGGERPIFFYWTWDDLGDDHRNAIENGRLDWTLRIKLEWRDVFGGRDHSVDFVMAPSDQPLIRQRVTEPTKSGELIIRPS